MKLVEDDAAHAVQRSVVGHAAGEDALGDHLYAGLWRCLPFKPDLVSHRLPHALAQELCHPLRHLPCGQSPGLQHDDATLGYGVENREGEECGFACSGGSHDDSRVALGQFHVELPRNRGAGKSARCGEYLNCLIHSTYYNI